MRKGTKIIRKVKTTSGEYFVYDLDENIFGKRPRIYGKTEDEVRKKIVEAEEDRKLHLSYQKPIGCNLKDYVLYYFKHIVGKTAAVEIKRLFNLFETAVFSSEINRDMTSISEDDILAFYNKLLDRFSYDDVLTIDGIMRKTYVLANETGAVNFDYSMIPVPQKTANTNKSKYIVIKEEEMKRILDYCLEDNCIKYGSGELVLVFLMYTGIKATEISELRYDDLNLDNHTVTVKNRTVPLSEECVSWLRKMIEEKKIVPDAKLLFANSKGNHLSLSNIQKTLFLISKRCGMPQGITCSRLHKSYVIMQLQKGVPIDELCEQYGYKKSAILAMQDEYFVKKALF